MFVLLEGLGMMMAVELGLGLLRLLQLQQLQLLRRFGDGGMSDRLDILNLHRSSALLKQAPAGLLVM
jgi:hypothetical protein